MFIYNKPIVTQRLIFKRWRKFYGKVVLAVKIFSSRLVGHSMCKSKLSFNHQQSLLQLYWPQTTLPYKRQGVTFPLVD